MKENLRLISCFSVALLIYSFILPPTLGRKNRRTFNGGQKSISTPTSTNTQLADPPKDGVQELVISGQSVQSKRQDPELWKLFRDYDLIRLDPRAAAAQVRNTGRLLLKTSRRNFDLKMALNDMRAPDYVSQAIGSDGVPRQLPKLPVNTYKGVVRGIEGAQARMAVKEGSIEGAIITEGERYFIQPARSLSRIASADEFVFYRGSDVINEGSTCGVTLADEVAAQETRASSYVNEATAEAAGPITPLSPLKIARLATDADAEYVSALGGAAQANAQIASIMNLVDGIYQVEIGVTFQIAFQNTWTDAATDPYVSTNPSTLLGQFRSHWNTNFTNIDRSLAHLWTGKDLDSGIIGVASLAVVCRSPQSAYGLSQRFPFDPSNPVTAQTVVLTAHEMGHNFSALHTNAPDGVPADIEQPCDNTIMEASVGPGSNFCPFSRSQIIGHANANASCLLDSAVPAPSPSCAETPISSGVSTNGTISNSDCPAPSRGARHFADRYSFNASAGQQVMIRMTQSSGDLDPYLYLIGPDGYVVTQNDDLPGSNNSLIGGSGGPFTLPLTGKYIIEATSFGRDQTGDYVINLTFTACTLSVNPTSQHFPASGGSGTINVTPSGNCQSYQFSAYPGPVTSWLNTQTTGGSGFAESLGFSVQPNTNAAGRRGFLLIAPTPTFGGATFGGLRIPITQSGTGPDCLLPPIASGQTINGDLSTSDCQSPVRGNGFYTDRYVFDALAGQQIAITLSSANAPTTDTFLTLMGPNGVVILTDDDSGGLTNSRIPGGTGSLTLGLPGTYIIEASTFDNGAIGPYTLTLSSDAEQWEPVVLTANQVEIKTWTFQGRTYAYVKLSFPNAGYRVANWGQPVRVGNDFSADAAVEKFTGASVQAVTTTAQIYDLGVVTDGNYTFSFKNSSVVVKSQAFTVSSAIPPPNPIDNAREFVRQQYRDFLNREADQAGEDFWTDNITKCSDPARRPPDQMGQTEEQCTLRQRETTSGAFFLSPEFQYTGYYVYRMYQGGLGRQPKLSEFTPDAQFVGAGIIVNGQLSGAKINQNKADFAQQFVNCTDAEKYRCAEFKAIYDGLNNQQYVDKLFQTTGVNASASDRTALVNGLNANPATETRASVLQKVVDGIVVISEGNQQFTTSYGQAFYNSESNRAFVQLEYFGYMKRDPDDAGYAFWLGKLNQFGGDFVNAEMVLAFISSPEYRARFGQP